MDYSRIPDDTHDTRYPRASKEIKVTREPKEEGEAEGQKNDEPKGGVKRIFMRCAFRGHLAPPSLYLVRPVSQRCSRIATRADDFIFIFQVYLSYLCAYSSREGCK